MNTVIASAVRTPIGAFQGAFSPLKASQLGAVAVREAVERANLSPEDVELVLMGNVLPAGMGQAPARQAAIYAGLPERTPAVTLNKMCGSGLEAIIQASRAVAVGDADIVVAGGMESMTNAPYLLPGARGGLRMGDKTLIDSMIYDGLWDAYNDKHMGSCAELCAAKYHFSREQQDEFAVCSYRRAQRATREGHVKAEIVPVEVKGRKGQTTLVSEDEGPEMVNFERLPSLRPAFEKEGTVTAANASSINDGAAATVVCSEETAKARGLPVLAKICGYTVNAQEPEWFTTAPVGAMKKLFDKLSWTPESVDLYEINEAFAVVTMAAMKEFKLPLEKVNVNGGAVALGHPIGASGARIVATLLHALKQQGKKRGVAAICIGGGEALAMGLELTDIAP
jgi:acetyl-CoA C-acetyltransferase